MKAGGRLVYATCSLLREENEEIVDRFLEAHPEFAPLHCGEILRQQGIETNIPQRMRLWPHVHGTDGFFGAAFERSRAGQAPGARAVNRKSFMLAWNMQAIRECIGMLCRHG